MILVKEIKSEEGVQDRLAVDLPYQMIEARLLFKQHIPGRKWDVVKKYWTVPYTQDTLDKLKVLFPKTHRVTFEIKSDIAPVYKGPFYLGQAKKPSPKQKKVPLRYPQAIDALEQDMILKRYSYSTIRAYKLHLQQLCWFYNDKRPSQLTIKEIKAFVFFRIKKEKIAVRTQKQVINALKYFYEKVVGRSDFSMHIVHPRSPKDRPGYLATEEVRRLLSATQNIKHRAILTTIYSGGLRLSEVIHLKLSDIRSSENYIRIQSGKGNKDRTTLLSPKLLSILREYVKIYRPKFYLFEGQTGGQYSARSIQQIMANAVRKSGVLHATPHTLRHSFATHLVQSGTRIGHVKELLGHQSIKTTEIYLHLSQNDLRNISSPLDKLDL